MAPVKLNHVKPLPDCDPEIGRQLWALEEVRRRTLDLVKGVGQATLDWEGSDGHDNAIGSLLYHIALVEAEWTFVDILGQDLPASVQVDLPYPAEDAAEKLTRVLGVGLDQHRKRLDLSRRLLLDEVRPMSLDEWRRPRYPAGRTDRQATPEWIVFHLIEHEAGHAFQISMVLARARRAGVSR